MGILYDDSQRDEDLIFRICQISAEDWNERAAEKHKLLLSIQRETAGIISQTGGIVLEKAFPRPPGSPSAFKRAATLILMMVLHPFLTARVPDEDGLYTRPKPFSDDFLKDFLVEFIFDSLPLVFGVLEVEADGRQIILNNWRGFPSPDFRTEFRRFLRWVGGNSELVKFSMGVPIYDDERLARIILGASLILEACYGPLE